MPLIRILAVGFLIIVSQPVLALQTLEPSRARLSRGEHQVVINDVRLWYRVAGRATGTPVVFLHGGPGQGSQSFAYFVGPFLERHNRMIYLDQRGAGRSERPWNEAYSIDLMVDDLEALRRAWRVPRIAVVGHSFGTILALEYASRYPNRVAHVVVAGSAPDIPAAFDIQCAQLERDDPPAYARAVAAKPEGWTARCDMTRAYRGAEGERILTSFMFPNPETANLLKEADERGGLRNTGVVGGVLFRQGLLTYRFTHPENVRAPLLVIAGSRDRQAVPQPQRALARAVSNGRIVEYEGAGHFMWVEQPERFARDVSAFLHGN
ncbi:MAG TPA: alpha/beta hydrolase [Allosphingosinicella sp.]|nr:alpha/beta hydrolase [Allosphingosinicella sp.]